MVSRQELSAQVEAEVAGWEGVSSEAHRFGGAEFQIDGREFGHIHRHNGMLDIPFPKKFGEALVGDGLTGPHHILLESGWTTFYVDSEETVTKGVRLLRLSYLFNVARRPDRAPSVDIERELAQLDLTGETAGLFEKEIARRRPKSDVQSVP